MALPPFPVLPRRLPCTTNVGPFHPNRLQAGRPYYSLIEMPRVRAARIREGAPDVARPAFSSCTLPIVWLPSWQENFYHAYLGVECSFSSTPYAGLPRCCSVGCACHSCHCPSGATNAHGCLLMAACMCPCKRYVHTCPHPSLPPSSPIPPAAETASVLHSLLGAVPWAQHAKLVIPTPEGLAMPAYLPGLLAPLTNSSVESLADFSARGTPTARPGEQQAQQVQRDSYKGSRHRCFRQLYWCGQQQWVGTYPLTAFGQRLLQHHGYTPPPPQPPSLAAQASAVTGSSNSSSAAASNDPAAASAGARKAQAPRQQRQRRQLRVLFHHRAGASRQLLNIDELVEACNTWRFVPQGPLSAQTASAQPASAQPLAANCSRVTLGSLEATLAAAQEADVMVGMHGANLVRRSSLLSCGACPKGGGKGEVLLWFAHCCAALRSALGVAEISQPPRAPLSSTSPAVLTPPCCSRLPPPSLSR